MKYKCFCKSLIGLRFRQIVCNICRTEAKLVQPSDVDRYKEMSESLSFDYHKLTKQAAIMLVSHHFWLLEQRKL